METAAFSLVHAVHCLPLPGHTIFPQLQQQPVDITFCPTLFGSYHKLPKFGQLILRKSLKLMRLDAYFKAKMQQIRFWL